jgi:copper resistance protein B
MAVRIILGASFELERDLLLTQKLITQPYIEADVIFSDDSNYAAKSGLSELKLVSKPDMRLLSELNLSLMLNMKKDRKPLLCKRQQSLKRDGNMVQASN